MKKVFNLALLAASMLIAGVASANVLTFETASGTAFTDYFSVTPTTTNRLILQVSGGATAFSALSFDMVDGPANVTASLVGGNLVAIFNDRANTDYANQFALTGGQTYQFKVSGITSLLPSGVNGVVSIQSMSGIVSAVPEPESYALMLAGLGLVGVVVRRRNSQLGSGV